MRCRLSFCKRLVAVELLADGQASRRLTSDSQLLTSWRRGSGAMKRLAFVSESGVAHRCGQSL